MLYAFLCYNSEEIVTSWTKEEDDRVMAQLSVVHDRLAAAGKLGPAMRLMATTTATTVRKSGKGRRIEAGAEPPAITDGPYAETKEQLLGFYTLECANLEEALEIARELAQANPGGAYEVRPISLFLPGVGLKG
jgi:hypothetical protein